MSSLLDVSVVICAYTEERWASLVSAVRSVHGQSSAPREVVVVVDHNPSLASRARSSLSRVLVVENSGPPGASGSRNAGVAVSTGDVIAFIDDDAEAAPDWLWRLVCGYVDPGVMGVGGALRPVWESGRPSWFPPEFDWVVGCSYTGLPTATAPVRNLICANMSVRRSVFEAVGGFRAGFGNTKSGTADHREARALAGDEETDLCIRALQRFPHGRWVYEPTAVVHHVVTPSRARPGYFVRRCYDEGTGKAQLCRLVGVGHGLSSERRYAMHALAAGTARELVNTVLHRDIHAVARAAAIVSGLAVTTMGYVVGATSLPARRSHGAAGSSPRDTEGT